MQFIRVTPVLECYVTPVLECYWNFAAARSIGTRAQKNEHACTSPPAAMAATTPAAPAAGSREHFLGVYEDLKAELAGMLEPALTGACCCAGSHAARAARAGARPP